MNIREITMIGLGAALMVVFTHLSIPIPTVPITLQLFGVILLGIIFTRRVATLSLATYILLGVVGMPVFSGFKSGIATLAGPTGGYIYSFIISVFIVATFAKKNNIKLTILGGYLGLMISYILGTIQLQYVLNLDMIAAISAGTGAGVYLIKDILLVPVAIVVGQKIKLVLSKSLANNINIG
ncbi:MAG: hypothetical protein BEN19_08705 [Epulopiscium sp. Nuni2H_MBin003]|nr:MAG: hypothetical protein BEN19_08705 [Epulopiscium sp. Nuni2H_MBin003]